jgi:hypothetical protein
MRMIAASVEFVAGLLVAMPACRNGTLIIAKYYFILMQKCVYIGRRERFGEIEIPYIRERMRILSQIDRESECVYI